MARSRRLPAPGAGASEPRGSRAAQKQARSADHDATHARWRVTDRRSGAVRTTGLRGAVKAEQRGNQTEHVKTRRQRGC
jgi:hypothetical protein